MVEDARPVEVDPRVRLAAERTLLAWVRTGLAMMGFGFVVSRFGLFLRELATVGRPAPTTGISQWIGIALVLLGVAANVFAALAHGRLLRRLERGEPYPLPRWSLGVIVTAVLAALGIVLASYLLVSAQG